MTVGAEVLRPARQRLPTPGDLLPAAALVAWAALVGTLLFSRHSTLDLTAGAALLVAPAAVLSRRLPLFAALFLAFATLPVAVHIAVERRGVEILLVDVLLVPALLWMRTLRSERAVGAAEATPSRPLVAASGITAAVVLVGLVRAIQQQTPVADVVRDLRPFAYLLVAMLLGAPLVAAAARPWLVRALGGVLSASALVLLAAQAGLLDIRGRSGSAHSLAGDSVVSYATQRLIGPTQHLALAVLWFAFAYAVLARRRFSPGTMLSVVLPAFLVTVFAYSRITLLGFAVVGLACLLASGRIGQLIRVTAASLGGLALLVVAGLIAAPTATHGALAASAGRVLSGTRTSALAVDPSIQFRGTETGFAVRAIEAHPLFGLGFGTPYRPLLNNDAFDATNASTGVSYVHDYYLWLLIKAGLVGALLALALLLPALRAVFQPDPVRAAVAISAVALLVTSVVSPALIDPQNGLLYGLALALLLRPPEPGPE